MEPLADLGHLVAVQADLACASAGVADAEHPDGVAAAALTLGTTLAMTDGALEQRAAQDEAEVGDRLQEVPALGGDVLTFHYWRGYSMYTAPLTAGGATTLQAISILKALGWEELPDKSQKYHARLEAMRIAWRDRLTLFGDPARVDVPMGKLMSQEYAEESAARVRTAVENKEPLAIETESREQGGTIHISAADRQGNLAALTLTHGETFGARVTVDGMGLILGHGMSRFDPRPGAANCPGPGKKPLHNMCPTVVLREGRPILALGGRGGRRIPNAVLDVLMNFVGEDRPIEESIDAPRMHTEGAAQVRCDGQWTEEGKASFRKMGYQVSAARFDPATGETAAVWR